jgi:hypothetical protein
MTRQARIIADALADHPMPLDELAGRVGANPDALKRLMRALIYMRQRRLKDWSLPMAKSRACALP